MESTSNQSAADAAAKAERLAQLTLIESRLANDRKSKLAAYLLWFFLGSLGAHCFYLHNWIGGLIRIFGVWVGTFALLCLTGENVPIYTKICAGIGILAYILLFLDLFRIPGMVQACTDKRRKALMKKLV